MRNLAILITVLFSSFYLRAQSAEQSKDQAFAYSREYEYRLAAQTYKQAAELYLLAGDSLEAVTCFFEEILQYRKLQEEQIKAQKTAELLSLGQRAPALKNYTDYLAKALKRSELEEGGEKEQAQKLEEEIEKMLLEGEEKEVFATVLAHELPYQIQKGNLQQADIYLVQALQLYKELGILGTAEGIALRFSQLRHSLSYVESSSLVEIQEFRRYLRELRKDIEALQVEHRAAFLMKDYYKLRLHQAYIRKDYKNMEAILAEQQAYLEKREDVQLSLALSAFYLNKGTMYKDVLYYAYLRKEKKPEKALSYARQAIGWYKKSIQIQLNRVEQALPYEPLNIIISYHNIGYIMAESLRNEIGSDSAEQYFYEAMRYALKPSAWKSFDENRPKLPDYIGQDSANIYSLAALVRASQGLQHIYQKLAFMEGKPLEDYKDKLIHIAQQRGKSLEDAFKQSASGRSSQGNRAALQLYYTDMQILYAYLYNAEPKEAYMDSVLLYLELSVSADMREKLNKKDLFREAQVPQSESEAYFALAKGLAKTASDRSLALQLNKQEELQELDKRFSEQSRELRALEQYLEETYPKYGQFFKKPKKLSLGYVQEQLGERQLLYFSLRVDWIVAISKDSVYLHLWRTSRLGEMKARFAGVLSDPNSAKNQEEWNWYCKVAQGHFNTLFANHKHWQEQGLNELVVLPSGELEGYMLDFLLSEPVDSNTKLSEYPYLIKDYTLQYIPSLSLWLQAKEQRQGRQPTHGILGFAPSYGDTLNMQREAYLKQQRQSLVPLLGAQKELQALQKSYGGTYYFGRDAQEERFRKELSSGSFALVHLAMHGLLNQSKASQSALAFSESFGADDGFLYAHEIAQMDINAELFVLSACETALGKSLANEGALSLARYMFYAGVPSSIATRWQVNDASTAWIMQKMYAYMDAGMHINKALRQAQLDFLEEAGEQAAHPFYWGPYMSMGYVDRSLSLASPKPFYKSPYLLAALLGSVLAVLTFFALRRKLKA